MLKFVVMAKVLRHRVSGLLEDRKGVTAMEYGIIAATTVVIVGGVVAGLGAPLTAIWNAIQAALAAAAG